jgi:DNA-binding MurR/RpiR family transcriptional regulator
MMEAEQEGVTVAVAPPTLQALRELVVRTSRGETSVSLGAKAFTVLARLVERPEEVAMRSITELASGLGVNASTLSRLARTLGYESFAGFQNVFRASVTHAHQRFYSEQGQRLLDGAEADDYLDVVVQLAGESVRNVDACLAQLDVAELRAAAARLASARRVRIHAVRQMHSIASLLSYSLGLIRPDVALLDGPGKGIAESLAQMEAGDLLLVSSISPYSRRVVDVARIASEADIGVIAITDSRASPLAAYSGQAFFIPHASSFISNSSAAYVVFCEGLVNLVAKELGGKAVEALKRQERFIEELDIELR